MSMHKLLILVFCNCVVGLSTANCENTNSIKENSATRANAILSYTDKDGLRLSEIAVKTFGIATKPIQGNGTFQVPTSSLVYFQDHMGVYRLKSGAYKLLLIQMVNRTSLDHLIRGEELKAGDVLVTAGASLLRVAEMQALYGSGGAE